MTIPNINLLPSPLGQLAPYIQDGILSDMYKVAMMSEQRMGDFFVASGPARLFPGQVGQTLFQSRPAEHRPKINPSQPGSNPTPSTHKGEVYRVQPRQYDGKINLDQLVNWLASGPRGMMEMSLQAKNAASHVDRVCARSSYGTYSGGHTVAINSVVAGTNLRVASINGFTELVDSNGQVVPVSSANPKYIVIAGTLATVIAAAADDATNSPFGPGTLTLGAAATWNTGDYVIAKDAPMMIYAGGGNSVDAISASDLPSFSDLGRAVSALRAQGAQPFSDGYFRCMLSPAQENALLIDPEIRAFFTQRGLENSVDPEMKEWTIGVAAGIRFMRCNRVPDRATALETEYTPGTSAHQSGYRTGAELSKEIWAEVVNGSGVEIQRLMIYGRDCGEMHYIPTNQLVPESGMLSSVSAQTQYALGTNGVYLWPQPWMRLLLGKPMDDHQLLVPMTYLALIDPVCPSDFFGGRTANLDLSVLANYNPRYKRAITIVHAA